MGPHLFPFRTQQLSPSAPMVLRGRLRGRVGICRVILSDATREGGVGVWVPVYPEPATTRRSPVRTLACARRPTSSPPRAPWSSAVRRGRLPLQLFSRGGSAEAAAIRCDLGQGQALPERAGLVAAPRQGRRCLLALPRRGGRCPSAAPRKGERAAQTPAPRQGRRCPVAGAGGHQVGAPRCARTRARAPARHSTRGQGTDAVEEQERGLEPRS